MPPPRVIGAAGHDPGAPCRVGIEPALLAHAHRPWHPDPPLTRTGRRQAAQRAEELANPTSAASGEPVWRVETATITAEKSIYRLPWSRWCGACVFSCDEGTPPEQLAARWPDLDFAHLEARWWGFLPKAK